ncbi:MAG: hypothetical protein FWE54_06325 [Methanimicrococcus sp.]|nr:hypothetical protein [Methanimicrococcus sp.]
MKPQQLLVLFMVVAAVIIASASFGWDVVPHTELNVTQLEIRFDNENATAQIYYEAGFLTQMYVSFFGSRNLDPFIDSFLYGFEEYQMISVQGNSATVKLVNSSRLTGNYYLHDTRPLGSQVDRLILYYPDGKFLTFENATETPNTFY